MNVQIDEKRFDALQMEVASAIAHEVYTALKLAGAPDNEQVQEIVARALFRIGAVLDGSRMIDGPDGPTRVMLTFATEDNEDALIAADGGSWIHEYAYGVAEEYFQGLRAGRR